MKSEGGRLVLARFGSGAVPHGCLQERALASLGRALTAVLNVSVLMCAGDEDSAL